MREFVVGNSTSVTFVITVNPTFYMCLFDTLTRELDCHLIYSFWSIDLDCDFFFIILSTRL